MIGNGGKIACKGWCHNIKLSMGDYKLQSDMYALPLSSCDVVLGIQWLMTLGPVLWDFCELWMQFKVDENKYTLKGIKACQSQIISYHHMEKLLKKGGKGVVGKLFSIQPALQESPEVQEL